MRIVMLLWMLSLLCLPLLAVSIWAEDDEASNKTGPGDVFVAWRAFREAAGEDWKVVWNRAGLAAQLHGTPLTVDAADRTGAARQLLARHATLFALDVAGMSLGDAREDEAQDGSSVVRFGVLYRVLPVLGAHVSVHFDRAGKVRAVLAHTTPIDIRQLDAGIDEQRVQTVIAARHLEREVEYVAEPRSSTSRSRPWR